MSWQAGTGDRPLAYRYDISAMTMVNVYKPKELAADTDKQHIRSVQFGAVFHAKYSQLPRCQLCDVVWEAMVG